MATIGFHCSHEQCSPSSLLRSARLAERAGFAAAMCSDHFFPWGEREGQSGFAWSWLGAALQATNLSFGTVCAPGYRYHPAVIAQAAATLAEMFPGRFWLAVGTGEALNEHITGEPWPDKPERNARLKECVDVMRALWAGETVTHEGRVRVQEAKLYTRPEKPPLLFGAALSAETAEWVGGWADGLITVAGDAGAMREKVNAFRHGGGEGKPMYLQVGLSFAATQGQAEEAARAQWGHCVLDSEQLADTPTPWAFDALSRTARRGAVTERLRVSSDVRRHADWLRGDVELGFEAIYLHNVARWHEPLIEAFVREVLPALR